MTLPDGLTKERVVAIAQAVQSTNHAALASATLLIYDHLITIDREIDLVWRKSWSFVKVLFIWHRYFGLACVCLELGATFLERVTENFCTFWFRWELLGFSAGILTSELVLLLWIFVIYNKDLCVGACLFLLFLTETISVFVILGVSIPLIKVNDGYVPGESYCAMDISDMPPVFLYYWIPILAYNLVILAMFVLKGYQVHRLHRLQSGNANSLLLKVYKGSVLNFIGILASYLLCCIFWLSADFALAQIPVVFALSFSITNATRLLLNIRHAYYTHLGNLKLASRQNRSTRSVHLGSVYTSDATREPWMYELRELRWDGP